MKLIFAIIHDEDASCVITELNKSSYTVTKISSTGGFLRSGNTTLLIGVEKDKVNNVIEIIKKKAKKRNKPIPLNVSNAFSPITNPIVFAEEVEVGGAIIFVINVEKYEKC